MLLLLELFHDVLRLSDEVAAAALDLYAFCIWLCVVFSLLAVIVCIYVFAFCCLLHFFIQAAAELWRATCEGARRLLDVVVGFPAYAVHILWTYIFCEGGWRLVWTISTGIRVGITYIVRPREFWHHSPVVFWS